MRRFILVLTLVTIAKVIMVAAPAFAQEASQQQYEVEHRSLNFELTVQGTPPADARFFGQGPLIGLPVQLVDPDGDGTSAGNTIVEVTVTRTVPSSRCRSRIRGGRDEPRGHGSREQVPGLLEPGDQGFRLDGDQRRPDVQDEDLLAGTPGRFDDARTR